MRPPSHRYPGVLTTDALHRIIWEKRDSRNRLKLHIGELAEELGRDYHGVQQTVTRLRKEGRIRVVHRGLWQIQTVEIADPDVFDQEAPPASKPMRWG